jgi:2-oxoglutarate ferredoxin oxidoreductase subunit alpha
VVCEEEKQILDKVRDYNFYEYIENKKSDTLLVAYGITSRVLLPLKERYAIFRPIRLFPVLDELRDIAKKYSKIIVVEMNDGQYKGELEGFLKRDIGLISLMGGKITVKEIEDELARLH